MAVTIRIKRGTATQWAARTTPLLSGEFGYDLTNKITKIGDGTTLWASLPSIGSSSNNTDTGDITFDGVKIIGAGTASGDGSNLGTIELVPDGDITSDQYLIIDPTTPNHIHIRSGGQQDNSSAHLYLGGERNNIEVSDPYRTVKVNTKPNGTENTYGNSNEASNTQFIHTSNADIIVGDTVRLYTGGATYVVTAVTQDSPSAGFITVVADGLSFITGEAYVFTRDQGYNNQWTFGNDAKIYFPNGSFVESPMNEGHLTIYASTSSTLNGGDVEISGGAANSDNKTGGTVNIFGGDANGYNGTGGNVVLETVSSGKILLSGNGGEFLNDMSNPDNQIATMSDIADANEYTDTAVAGLGNSIDGQYVPVGDVGNIDGVAPLDGSALIPDSYIPSSIARDSELFSGSYNDLSDKPSIALGAVQWTANHYLLPGGENTRYLAGDIVYDGGNIYVANYDNESLPTSNTEYWTLIGTGNRLNIDGRDVPNITYDQLSGKPTIPDPTGYATETYVGTAISNLVDTAPETLNTLNELAAALGDDPNFATTISTSLGNKLDSSTASSTYAPIASPTFTGTVGGITKSMVGLGNVDNTTDANKPVSTATQTALNLKLDLSSPAVDYYITNSGSGAYLVNGVSNGNIYFEKGKRYRIHVNASGHPFWIQNSSGAYNSGNVYNTGITNNGTQSGHIIVELPSNAPQLYYACQYHSSMVGSIITGTTFATYKALADLSNVNNTSDANKPVSTATQIALDLKANLASPTFTGTVTLPSGTIATTQAAGNSSTAVATTAFVGTAVANLVDSSPELLNTLDEIAAAIGDDPNFASTITTSIGLKAPLASPTFTGTVSGITSTMVGLGNVDNTSDANKPVSTATQTALDLKLSLTDPAVDYYITNSGSGSYTVNGVDNGLIYFEKGKKYRIHVNASGHPFWIQTVSGAYSSGNVYSTGITNNGAQVGNILVELPQSAPDDLYYACQYHSSMQGSISVQSQNTITINSKSSSYTIAPIDSGRLIEMSGGGTLTITDSASFPVGFAVDVLQTGSSQVTIAGNGFTPNATPGLKLRAQWSSATLIKRALNSWVVLGDLSA